MTAEYPTTGAGRAILIPIHWLWCLLFGGIYYSDVFTALARLSDFLRTSNDEFRKVMKNVLNEVLKVL